jgi:drug/metabolite transporter (DMT)-like permease
MYLYLLVFQEPRISFALVEASLAPFTFFAQPVVGTLLGWLLLGPRITLLFPPGSFLIGL